MAKQYHPKRAAGIVYVKIDGEQIPARGSFTWRLSGEKKEYECNADGSGYITGKAEPGFIKGAITDLADVDVEKIRDAESVTVTLEKGNGKVISAKDAIQIDAMEGNSETGEIPVEWRSDSVQEIK